MTNGRTIPCMAVGAVLVLLAGCGGSDHDESHGPSMAGASRTVEVEMRDIAYDPTTVSVPAGETVKFVFRNVGEAVHDAFIGDEAAQAGHGQDMRHSEGGHHGDSGLAVTVEPGKSASLTYTFDEPGSVLIGCHQPGHYEAGMKLTVVVV